MSKMGQYVYEMQEYAESLQYLSKMSYSDARRLFEERYKGAGIMFDQWYREATGMSIEDAVSEEI
jgi:hypothetical protein